MPCIWQLVSNSSRLAPLHICVYPIFMASLVVEFLRLVLFFSPFPWNLNIIRGWLRSNYRIGFDNFVWLSLVTLPAITIHILKGLVVQGIKVIDLKSKTGLPMVTGTIFISCVPLCLMWKKPTFIRNKNTTFASWTFNSWPLNIRDHDQY